MILIFCINFYTKVFAIIFLLAKLQLNQNLLISNIISIKIEQRFVMFRDFDTINWIYLYILFNVLWADCRAFKLCYWKH